MSKKSTRSILVESNSVRFGSINDCNDSSSVTSSKNRVRTTPPRLKVIPLRPHASRLCVKHQDARHNSSLARLDPVLCVSHMVTVKGR